MKVELATDPDRDGHFVAARSVTTDAEGRFVFDAQRGEGFLLRAIAPTGWLADDPLTIWGDREVATLRLRRTSRLEGRLRVVGRLALPESLSLSRGTEVVYVSTSAGGNGRTPSAWRREAPIAADGRWSLDEAPMSVDLHVEVRWKVWAEAGFIPPEPLRRVRAGGPPVVIDLVPGATIRGRVRHADEAPFVPTELSSLSVHTASEELIPHGLRWGPEGHFEIVGLPSTSVKLELTDRMGVSERFWRVEQWVLPGTANVEFVIPSWGAVSIEVPREGRGRAQLTVWEAGTLRLWGGNGRVEFSNNVARIEGVPANRDLVFGLVLFSEGQVATFGPLRAGGSALVNPGPPAAFYLEDTERRAKCLDATGPLYAIAPSATWPLDADCFRPPLGNNRFGRSVGPPPGRYDLVELLPDGKTTVLVRDIEARVPPRDPNEDDDR